MPEGKIVERFLDERRAAARVACLPTVIPQPGQYLLAYDPASDEPLAVPVFSAGSSLDGFLAAPPLPRRWSPGVTLQMRGPLGHGFKLSASARRVALAVRDVSPSYLLGLIQPARAQGAAICLICDDPPEDLPTDVEIRPLAALGEICQWADFLAVAGSREAIRGWRERFKDEKQLKLPREAQALVVTPMPCGGLAKCVVCSVETKRGVELACEDGPVFQFCDLM
jgi:NAD(P)H-flavin reductase